MKLSEAFSEYRRIEIQGRGCSLKTDEGAKYAGIVAVRYFGDINVKKIKLAQISDYYLSLVSINKTGRGKPVTQNTARGYIMQLRSVLKYCDKCGIKTVDCNKIIIPKREKKYANFIDLDQYNRLYNEANTPRRGYAKINRIRNALIIKVLFYTGLRISELFALNRDTIRNREFIVIGKSKNPRPCFITKDIEQDIKAYLAIRKDDNPALFISNKTGERITPSNVRQVFRRITKALGMDNVTPHTLRHSFATRLIDDKVDIRYVADLLGHQSLDTTKQYTHIRNYQLREIYMNILEKSP
jgi:site-specific recombinase XerD